MKTIAWIVYGSLEQRTGGTIYDALIVDGLRRSGERVEVISLRPPVGTAPREDDARASFALVRQLRQLGPDVVVGDELCFRELALVFSRVTFARRVLLVHHLTSWEEERRPAARARARRWEATLLRRVDAVIATSRATQDRLVHEGHRGRIDVVLPGADRLPIDPRRATSDTERVFLFVGSIIPRKRVHDLVEAFLTLEAPAQLRLVGDRDREPAYAREIDRRCASAARTHTIALLGEIDEAALARELSNASALVVPSSLEGYGIAATEAARAGLPVIAARTPGLSEALAPCADAVLFFDDRRGLALAMQRIAAEHHALSAAASRARMPSWSDAISAFRRALT